MGPRVVLRRIGKFVLWCVGVVCILSFCLRIYTAWQVPKAKRLLNDVVKLRPGQVADENVVRILREHHFTRDGWPHDFEESVFSTRVGTLAFASPNRNHGAFVSWLLDHSPTYLGLRVWSAGASVTIKDGRIQEIRSGAAFFDVSPFGIGGQMNGTLRMRFPSEASPDLQVWEYPRYRDKLPQLDYTSLASSEELRIAFEPDFSCIWKLGPCTSGYEVFPQWRDLASKIGRATDRREMSDDPCPASRMYSRVRDSQVVALGTISQVGRETVQLHLDQIFKLDQSFPFSASDSFNAADVNPKLFKGGLKAGTKVISTWGNDCNPLPATKENLEAFMEALRRYPPEPGDPRVWDGMVVTIPEPLPAELRKE